MPVFTVDVPVGPSCSFLVILTGCVREAVELWGRGSEVDGQVLLDSIGEAEHMACRVSHDPPAIGRGLDALLGCAEPDCLCYRRV
jgi:hypothetical protein